MWMRQELISCMEIGAIKYHIQICTKTMQMQIRKYVKLLWVMEMYQSFIYTKIVER